MRNFISFFIKYPIWSNAIKILIMGLGLVSLLFMKSSFFPERESKAININLVYPGASPEEIERGVIQKIEDNLRGVQGIERFQSTSKENSGSINIDVLQNYDTDDVLQDVKNAVDRINSFPLDMEPPVVAKRPQIEFAISFSISGEVDLRTLKTVSQNVEDDLREVDGISQVNITGFPDEEIVLELKEENLRKYNMTFDMAANALKSANVDMSAGAIKSDNEEIFIRLENKKYYAEELQDVVIMSTRDGKRVTVSDLGEIKNKWSENPQRTYVNTKPAVMVTVNKIYGENIIEIADRVKEYVEDFNEKNSNVQAQVIDDATKSLNERIDMLISNGVVGALLVMLSLALFLNLRLAFWVALAIPFCFLGMFLVALISGITINVISLFGCIVVVGILVDDGIVVAENIYQNYEAGEKPFKAALEGTMQVIKSVFFAIITTVVAFMPFFFLDTPGPRISDMSFVVIFTLVFSFLEALLILPTHLAHSKALQGSPKDIKGIRKHVNTAFEYFKNKIYVPILDFLLNHKLIAFAIGTAFLLITVGGIGSGIIRTTFFPNIEVFSFAINVELPSGSREFETNKVLDKIENAVWRVNDQIIEERGQTPDIVEKVVKNVALSDAGWGRMEGSGANKGNLKIILSSDDEIRGIQTLRFASLVKQEVGPLYNVEKAEFGSTGFFGKPISVRLIARDLDELQKAKQEIKQGMFDYAELRDVTDNDPQGLREIKIQLKEKAYLLGFTSMEISRQIRQGFFGSEVQRIQRGQDEVKVWVRYVEKDRSGIDKFEDMRIRSANGNQYPLEELISYRVERGPISINHVNGRRELTVEAEVVNPDEEIPKLKSRIDEEIVQPILAKYPSVTTIESGQTYRLKKLQAGTPYLLIAIVLMYFLIALSFQSFAQALIVMGMLPLGIAGALWGHVIQGNIFSVMSFYGIIALVGIIVNDSIVLINTMNFNIKSGMPYYDSLRNAAISRFRPILLTSITTILGLIPLLSETSIQAQFLIPMAISVAYGLFFASIFIIFLLPTFLLILNSYKAWVWKLIYKESPKRKWLEPAWQEEEEIGKLMG